MAACAPPAPAIAVDTNAGEAGLYAALVQRFGTDQVERRRLDVGDVVLSAESGTVVVERKTWLDWAKSMTDGRYASQKARLRSLTMAPPADDDEEEDGGGGGGGNAAAAVLYLIEGTLTGSAVISRARPMTGEDVDVCDDQTNHRTVDRHSHRDGFK